MKQKRLLLREDVKVKKLSVIKVKFHKFDVCRKFLSPIKLEKNDIVIVPSNDKGSNSSYSLPLCKRLSTILN